jgi:hypothetical protein
MNISAVGPALHAEAVNMDLPTIASAVGTVQHDETERTIIPTIDHNRNNTYVWTG